MPEINPSCEIWRVDKNVSFGKSPTRHPLNGLWIRTLHPYLLPSLLFIYTSPLLLLFHYCSYFYSFFPPSQTILFLHLLSFFRFPFLTYIRSIFSSYRIFGEWRWVVLVRWSVPEDLLPGFSWGIDGPERRRIDLGFLVSLRLSISLIPTRRFGFNLVLLNLKWKRLSDDWLCRFISDFRCSFSRFYWREKLWLIWPEYVSFLFLFWNFQYHPDVCRGSNCGVQFHLINEAYDVCLSHFFSVFLVLLVGLGHLCSSFFVLFFSVLLFAKFSSPKLILECCDIRFVLICKYKKK